jgi:hypothetical protein
MLRKPLKIEEKGKKIASLSGLPAIRSQNHSQQFFSPADI